MSKFFPLKVKSIRRETPQAVSLEFEVSEELQQTFRFKAGQYVTLKKELGGKEVRRAYSICTAPGDPTFRVTVKEVSDGTFSVYANNKLKPGEILEVHPPEGKFIFEPSGDNGTHNYAAFAAGSGITPVLSIIKSFLKQNKKGKFILVYGNRNPEETIFYKELLELQLKYPDFLFIEFVYSRCNEENCHFGRIEESTVNYIIKNKFKDLEFSKFFLCGPEQMIDKVQATLLNQGIPEKDVLFELFSTETEGEVKSDLSGETELTVIVDDEEVTLQMPRTKTVLQAALDYGLDVPYSCQGGICSSCVAKITQGKAEMEKNSVLVDSEIEEGLVLTCQAHPTTEKLRVDYDEV